MKLPHSDSNSRLYMGLRAVGYGLTPAQYDALDLDCWDCKITCESLRDPEAVEECLKSCNSPGGPCDYLTDFPTE